MNQKKKPILFTGITPTGPLTIGHYFGIIKKLKEFENSHEIVIMIADLHALTTFSEEQDKNYKNYSFLIAKTLMACDLECRIFIQSEVSDHLFLSHLLSSYITVSELKNMIQYKEKKKKDNDGTLSLLSYPCLMVADIMIYNPEIVIVGEDQRQHIELTTKIFKKTRKITNQKNPNFLISSIGGRIMGMKDPEKKMSKSSGDYISILDSENQIRKSIMRAKTDSDDNVFYDQDKKHGISNLLTIYSLIEKKEMKDCESFFSKINYNNFKNAVADSLIKELSLIKKKFESLSDEEVEKNILICSKIMKKRAASKIKIIKRVIKL